MRKSEVNKMFYDFTKKFKNIFNERMNEVRGNDKVVSEKKLNEISLYVGGNIRRGSGNRNGFNLKNELQIEMRKFIGEVFGLGYYVLDNEIKDLDLMKDKKLNSNGLLYKYLMKFKKDKNSINNKLFYIDDDDIVRVIGINNKLNYPNLNNEYRKKFFSEYGLVDREIYDLLVEFSSRIKDYVERKYEINSKWFYKKECWKFIKKDNYEEYLKKMFKELIGVEVFNDEELEYYKNTFNWNQIYNEKFNKSVWCDYWKWVDKNNLIKWVMGKELDYRGIWV